MSRIRVGLGKRSHDILIEDRLIDGARDHLGPLSRRGRLLVVSDEQVWALLGARIKAALCDIETVPILVEPGEESKSWQGLRFVVDELLAYGIERGEHVIAFGGGVIGDLAGFASAIVNRGCPFVQIPTSLLAQVDSSVGGKTAINAAAGKNLVGAFHQPSLVLIDPSLLGTLDDRQLRSGYAEIVKYALVEDANFFVWLDARRSQLLGEDRLGLDRAIAVAVRGKTRIVEDDELETGGRRALLNLGHTFGHALEAETGYSDRLLHGEAVALGCVLAFDFSVSLGLCANSDADRVRAHLDAVGLPTSLSHVGLSGIGNRLVSHMRHDKKRVAGRTPFILAHGIGKAFVDHEVDLGQVASFLDRAS